MKIRLLLSVLLLVGLSADASIRVIGRGGGYGEMKALTALAQLKTYLTPCLLNPKSCYLSDADHSLLLKLDKLGILNTDRAQVDFFTDPDSLSVFRYSNTNSQYIGVSTKALYTPEGKPVSYPFIISTMLAAWLHRPHIEHLMHSDFFYNFDQAFRAVTVNESALKLDHGLIFRELQISMNGQTESLIAIEKPQQTVDLTSKVAEMLVCTAGKARILEVSNIYKQGEYIVGQIRWQCDANQIREGQFHLKYVVEQHPHSVDHFAFQVVKVKEISVATEDCEKRLTEEK